HVLVDRTADLVVQEGIVTFAGGNADDPLVQFMVGLHLVDGGEDLPAGQIAGGSEQHEGVGAAHPPVSRSIVCPPNWLRRAEITFMLTSSSRCCEVKRANSAADMTGAETPASTASCTVQRPSPESAATDAMPSSSGVSSRARTRRSRSQERTTLPCCHDPRAA